MPAYFLKDQKCGGRPARDIPEFARLRAGNKWKSCDSNQLGGRGVVAFLGDQQPAPNSEGWYECADGLFYLPGRALPAQSDLVRPHSVNGVDYETSRGVTITIPIASSAPRKLLFSKGRAGDPSEEWANRAFALFDKLVQKEFIAVVDPQVLSLVCDAIGHVYYTTPELLDELGWITSADIDPILVCLMGQDPKKALQPAGDTSPSPAGA